MTGPLSGVRVVEFAGLGPTPFAGMVLADLGADVIRIDRADRAGGTATPTMVNEVANRGKRSIALDLKKPEGVEVALALIGSADAMIEGFRPGVMERLGLSPGVCLAVNTKLAYVRMTGWGQSGPMAQEAGHDIDYISLTGVLHSVGTPETPIPPLNLVGDFGGGGMLGVIGILAAVISARETGIGQVIDAAMIDGSALQMASHHGFVADGWWDGSKRASNLLDGGAPYYSVYETSDGRHVAVGALEPQFFAELVSLLGLDPSDVPGQLERERWPEMRDLFAKVFAERTREEWADHFAGSDACVAPILSISEAPSHPHNHARGVYSEVDGVVQPSPAPRFSSTPGAIRSGPSSPGEHTDEILAELDISERRASMLREIGAIA